MAKVKNVRMAELARIRWGDKLTCSIKPLSKNKSRAYCVFNGTAITVLGKDNKEVYEKLFKILHGLSNKSTEIK